jgi:ABC-type bacteriocin/lantibiotic exporter with double-glycine peptidase domain
MLIVSAVLAILSLVALCMVLLIRTNQSQEFKVQAAENCRQINVLKAALVDSIDQAEQRALARSDNNLRAEIREYYVRQRMRFEQDECPKP